MKNLRVRLHAKARFDRWLREYPRATPIAVFCIACVLVGVAAWSVELAQRRMRIADWQAEARDIAAALEQQAASEAAYLEATSALFSSVDTPSPELFHSFIDRLQAVYDLNGVVALGWLQSVDRAQLPGVRARMAAEGRDDFTLQPIANPQSWPVHAVTMIEPQTPANETLIGFDMSGEARRAAAMDRARRTDALAATQMVKLRQDIARAHSPGLLVFAPVWVLKPTRSFRGFVFMSVRTGDFVTSSVSARLRSRGRIEILSEGPQGSERIYSSAPAAGRFEASLQQPIAVFDQQWTLRFSPVTSEGPFPLSLFVLASGGAFSLLLLAYILLVQRRNLDLQTLVDAQLSREKERAAFVRELNHRVNNTLANVTSLISLTRRRATDVQSFADSLLMRVRALASSHALLEGGQWGPTDLRSLVTTQLGVSGVGDERILIDGPDVLISANAALAVGLALHELASNAGRYGALSTDEGKVTISWHVSEEQWVDVEWEESGGPPVEPPKARGFGLNLIERALADELGHPIVIEFDPQGLRCRFRIALREPRDFQIRR